MSDKKNIAPAEGPNGVDRWTSNGYGLRLNGKKVEPPKTDNDKEPDIDDIEES